MRPLVFLHGGFPGETFATSLAGKVSLVCVSLFVTVSVPLKVEPLGTEAAGKGFLASMGPYLTQVCLASDFL